MSGCFLCIKQALMGGVCGGCGANILLVSAMFLWFALKAIAMWLYADEGVTPGEVLVRAADAVKVWMQSEGGCASHKTKCASETCCEDNKETSKGCCTSTTNGKMGDGAYTVQHGKKEL